MNVLDENSCDGSNIIKLFLFEHKVSKHTSMKLSSFFRMYNREPTLLVDVKYSLVGIEENQSEHV